MDLHLPPALRAHHWEHRSPDWLAAVVAGLVAGAALMTLELLWAAVSTGADMWRTTHEIAAIVLGPDTARSSSFSWSVVTTALVSHYVLGIAFGVLLAIIIAPFRLDSSLRAAAAIGALFGAVLYLLNFYGMSAVFDWFAEMRSLTAFAAHVLFGVVAAITYRQLERPASSKP
jgi:hypothetical protein